MDSCSRALRPRSSSPGCRPARPTRSTKFKSAVDFIDLAGSKTPLKAGQPISLSESPVFVVGLPADVVKQAAPTKPFPGAETIRRRRACDWTTRWPADPIQGLFPTAPPALHTFADGSQGILVERNAPTNYYVHPSFATLDTSEYYVRITVRRTVPGGIGMNCIY